MILKMLGGSSELITFSVYDYYTRETTQYEAVKGMTWDEWIDSNYNPYLPNNSEKRFSKTSDMGEYSGNVYYHMWDPDYFQIDYSVELMDDGSDFLISLTESIINGGSYIAG